MSKPISELHFRVVDHGLFLPVAQRLAREAGKVTYWSPHEKEFPTVRDLIGDGFPDFERVESPMKGMDEVDCFVFPDIGFLHMQEHFLSLGFPVWGARSGMNLEIQRGRFLETMSTETDMLVPKYQKVLGLTALRDHLRDREDLWIKISRFRGDWETFHWRSWEEDENTLDGYAVKFGPFRDKIAFYVFDPIDTTIEDGCDTWCIDGQFPELIIHGMECKDKGYIGAFQKFKDLPAETRIANDQFGPVLGKRGYRGFFSTEVRITDEGDSYFIDPTCRAGSPPSQCMAEMIGNYAEVIWGGALGQVVEPEPAAKFGVQALLKTGRESDEWATMKLDQEVEQWVKSANVIMVDGKVCAPPDPANTGCEDWLVGIGDTIEEAIAHLRHNIELLPDGISCDFTSLADLLKEVQAAEEKGMEFTDQPVPEPAVILEDK